LFSELNWFRKSRATLGDSLQELEHVSPFQRLAEVVVHPGGETTIPIANHRVRRHRHDGGMLTCSLLGLTDADRRFKAVHLGHLHIHEDQIECLLAGSFHSLSPIDGVHESVAILSNNRCASLSPPKKARRLRGFFRPP
jgi:hypothetical protein